MIGLEWSLADYGALVLFAGVVGAAIGATGIGGVVLAPYLMTVAGMPVVPAIATTIAAFSLVGLSGTFTYARRGLMDWQSAFWLGLGAAPGAWAGSLAVAAISSALVAAFVALLMLVAGVYGLLPSLSVADKPALKPGVYLPVGLVVGVVSGLSGTGGPVMLVPILVALGQPAILIVALSQIIQVPISLSAVTVHLPEGRIDWAVTIILALAMSAGLQAGARIAVGRNPATLRKGLSWTLVFCGGFLLVRQFAI